MKNFEFLFTYIAAITIIGGASVANAGGLENCLQSEQLTGAACVGAPVSSEYPNVYGNPATLSKFDTIIINSGVRALIIGSTFESNTPLPQGGNDDGRAGKNFIIPTIHVGAPITDKVSVGLSVVSPFGLGFEYDDAWAGRFYVQEAELQTITGTLGLSYKLSPSFDIGVGVSTQYASTKVRRAVNNVFDASPDGSLTVEGDDFAVGVVVGALWRPEFAPVEIGVSYRSGMKQNLEGDAEAVNVGPTLSALGVVSGEANVQFDLPQQVSLAAAFQAGENTRLVVDGVWTEWSAFDETVVAIESGFLETTRRD